MVSHQLYLGLIALTAIERLAELVRGRRPAAWSFERGGVEHGRGQWPFMVTLHTGFLIGCVTEVWVQQAPFIPELGWPMLAIAIGCQGLRWWCIRTLGKRWNHKVIVVPGMPHIQTGPYRWFSHPNYVAVVLEGIALPLIHTAVYTAVTFTVLNAILLTVRIRCENAALSTLERHDDQ